MNLPRPTLPLRAPGAPGWTWRARSGDLDGAILLLAATGILAVVVGTLTGMHAGVTTSMIPGIVAVAAGARVVWPAGHPLRRGVTELWRRLIGFSVVVWGTGQFVIGLEHTRGTQHPPDVGDYISLAAAPFVVAGLTLAIRSRAFIRPMLRLSIDAVTVASIATLLVWRLATFSGAPTAAPFVAGVAFIDVLVAAFALLVAVRRPTAATVMFSSGLGIFAVTDVWLIVNVGPSGAVPAPVAVGYCVAGGLLVLGLRGLEPEPDAGDDVARDSRQASTTLVLFVVGAALAAILGAVHPDDRDAIGYSLAIVAMLAFIARHVIDHVQRRVMFAQLRNQARRDPLTAVGNRLALHEVAASAASYADLAVVVVGLDHLDRYQRALGHADADALLVRAAAALEGVNPEALTVARLETDEFAVVGARISELEWLAAASRAAVDRAVSMGIDPSAPRVRVTAGASWGADDDASLLDAVARAQRARHAASQVDGVELRVYDAQMRELDDRERKIDELLPPALAAGAVEPWFQPIVDLRSGRVVAVEALARWDDPVLGEVTPSEFVRRAEISGEIDALGHLMLQRAAEAAIALDLPHRGIQLSVNVSPGQLGRRRDGHGFTDRVAQVLEVSGLPASALVVEVTESMLVQEDDPAVTELTRLASMGVRIAIDDFGSGFWALGYLRWLPAHVVKIDRSLVLGIERDERSAAVFHSIVDLCRRTGMTTVAEGIEDPVVAEVAATIGVDRAQGWLYAPAVPAGELTETIRELERWTADDFGELRAEAG